MNKLIVITGPTAIGKTDLSISIAQQFPSAIVSGDAMQIYRGMDIGTGKVTNAEKSGIPHYMLDIRNPDEPFSVAAFQKEARRSIATIHDQGKIPILVGGSGLYLQAILYDYTFSDRKRHAGMTEKLEERLKKEGNEVLYQELVEIDPEQAKSIHPNNIRRVIRALETYYTTGKTMTERHQSQSDAPLYDAFMIGLAMEREELYNRINERVDKMFESGLLTEAEHLYSQGYADTQAMKAIGYKEIISYLEGETTLEAAKEILKQNSRRYAKRQYTWFKNKMDIHWYQMETSDAQKQTEQIIHDCRSFLERA